ncbi:QueT transporter family protein [Clostridium felsineum]|uniref:Queuosine transporter QueT n=1 Tax=Clostridium felsineum TaxID=36839 RepID=A0A1S8MCG3_9CLOT|nr:QueT transporter family protein [Clostridium felsineum]URZ00051.1 Queuosine precursor transporter QueT [Clostridium felsineum]URZ07304.1 Queuosine precursor transporter QueT [Clostridium felsineum]URZ12335.1 Queuosine precursor transporter QueT [Clostridium felsineum]URZ16997.1 Queuosine precursor transporter QueT [Clostridium felsineum DSM 794]
MKKRNTLRILVVNALIAAIYAVLTLGLSFLSYGQIQIRVSEALTVLPFFSGYYVIGLTLGCFIANIFSVMKLDMIFGTLATFIAACLTYFIGKSNIPFKKYIAPLPPIISNAVIVGLELKIATHAPFFVNAIWVGIGEIVACFVLGLPLLSFIEKSKILNRFVTFK